MLLNVAPDIHRFDEQAMIVAEATAQYKESEACGFKTRSASLGSAGSHNSRLLDAVLAAMERVAQVETPAASDVFATGLFREATLKSLGIRLGGTMGDMAVLDDEDFDHLFNEDSEGKDDKGLWEVEDIYGDESGRDSIYSVLGKQKKHRSESQAH